MYWNNHIHLWCPRHKTLLIDPHKSWIAVFSVSSLRSTGWLCVYVCGGYRTLLLCLCSSLYGVIKHFTVIPGDLDVALVCVCVR